LKRFFQSEIGAALVWVFASLTMAALLTPWIYQGGKHLAGLTEAGDFPGLIESLGKSCGRAKIGRYFDRALLISALAFLPFLLRRIRGLRASPGKVVLARMARFPGKSIAIQIVVGCVIASGMLWALGGILEAVGVYYPKTDPPALGKLLPKILIPAVVAPLLEEWLFRGLLLGLWLRFARPLAACIGTSLLFAFLHFIEPPDGTVIADPTHPLAGFELLGKILLHFTDPMFFVTDFATLLAVGLILAWARVRTGALWFSIGLHAGWIIAFKAFSMLYRKVPEHPLCPWGVGDNLRSGALPLVALGLTAVICHFALKRFPPAGSAAHDGDHEDLAKPGPA
jgi:membrane protease YdiL (CAAX protease family)